MVKPVEIDSTLPLLLNSNKNMIKLLIKKKHGKEVVNDG